MVLTNNYDTFNQAKRILEIDSGLSLDSLAIKAGFFPSSIHDAYQDAFALIPIFSHLKLTEYLATNHWKVVLNLTFFWNFGIIKVTLRGGIKNVVFRR